MTNTYIDAISYSKASTGLQLAGQIGNIGRIQAASAGDSTLTLVQVLTSVALSQYDSLYITDGAFSEVCRVGSGGAVISDSTIPLESPLQFDHVGGTVFVTDGTQGSLGQSLFEASRWIEDICHQSLFETTYENEILTMPTSRAAIDNQANIHFRPRHFPITVLTSISIRVNQQDPMSYDPSQAIIDSDQQTVDIPLLSALPGQNQQGQGYPWLYGGLSRQSNAWITIAYTAGYADIPWAITRACTLLTSEMFSQTANPIGADSITQGKRSVTFTTRGDTSGESLLVKQAKQLLSPYIAQSF